MRRLHAARRTDSTKQRELSWRRYVQTRRELRPAGAARGRGSRATFACLLPETTCRIEFLLSDSKQRTALHSTRNWNAPPPGRLSWLAPRAFRIISVPISDKEPRVQGR